MKIKMIIMKNILIIVATAFCCLFAILSEAQTAAADNKPSQTITFRPIPKGPAVSGVFQGRPPCIEIAKQLKISTPADCIKLKWVLTLYHKPATLQPTTYTLTLLGAGDVIKQADGNSYQQKSLEGKWTIIKGLKSDPDAEVYRLESGTETLYLLKGDENVLFVLDENKEFRVGNEDFSHTLNRVELVAGNK
jgi:hypothetical protein